MVANDELGTPLREMPMDDTPAMDGMGRKRGSGSATLTPEIRANITRETRWRCSSADLKIFWWAEGPSSTQGRSSSAIGQMSPKQRELGGKILTG